MSTASGTRPRQALVEALARSFHPSRGRRNRGTGSVGPRTRSVGRPPPRAVTSCLCSVRSFGRPREDMGVAIGRPTVIASESKEGTLVPVFETSAAKLPEPPYSKLTPSNVKMQVRRSDDGVGLIPTTWPAHAVSVREPTCGPQVSVASSTRRSHVAIGDDLPDAGESHAGRRRWLFLGMFRVTLLVGDSTNLGRPYEDDLVEERYVPPGPG